MQSEGYPILRIRNRGAPITKGMTEEDDGAVLGFGGAEITRAGDKKGPPLARQPVRQAPSMRRVLGPADRSRAHTLVDGVWVCIEVLRVQGRLGEGLEHLAGRWSADHRRVGGARRIQIGS